MIRVILWTAFIALLAVLWGREILAFGEARRRMPDNHKRDELRFRRRTLGLFVLLLLVLSYDASNFLFDPDTLFGRAVDLRTELIYFGMCFILLIWLLIIAARDFHDIAESYLSSETNITLQTLTDVESEILKRKSGDDAPIPPMNFEDEKSDENKDENPA